MKKVLLVAAAMSLGLAAPAYAGHFNTSGVFIGKVSPSIERALNAFRRTHDARAFERLLASLVEHDPALADDAVEVALGLPPDEQALIAIALAEAHARLTANNPDGAALVNAALNNAPPDFVTAFNTEAAKLSVASAGGTSGGDGGGGNGGGFGGGVGFGGGGGGGGGSVSPNRP